MEERDASFYPQHGELNDAEKIKTDKQTKKRGSKLSSFFFLVIFTFVGGTLFYMGYTQYMEESADYEWATDIQERCELVKSDGVTYGEPYVETKYYSDSSDDDGLDNSYYRAYVKQDVVITYELDGQEYEASIDGITVYYKDYYHEPTAEEAIEDATEEGKISSGDTINAYVDKDDPSVAYERSKVDIAAMDDGTMSLILLVAGAIILFFMLVSILQSIFGLFKRK